MIIIRFEKESLNDYMIYQIHDSLAFTVYYNNHHNYIAYPNDNTFKLRLYFKIISYNKDKECVIHEVLEYIQTNFSIPENDWTITVLEKMISNTHISYIYFYSNNQYKTLKEIKEFVNKLSFIDFIVDDSIYYRTHSKYKDYIYDILPNQTYNKYSKNYKLLKGSLENINLFMKD